MCDNECAIEVRGITRNSNNEEYALLHTFNTANEGPAQTQAYLNRLPGTITHWVESYQKRNLMGTDIYGCLHKSRTISQGMLPGQKLVLIFESDLIHVVSPDPGPARFDREVSVYTMLANDAGSPAMLSKARTAFERHVEESGSKVKQAADTSVLADLL